MTLFESLQQVRESEENAKKERRRSAVREYAAIIRRELDGNILPDDGEAMNGLLGELGIADAQLRDDIDAIRWLDGAERMLSEIGPIYDNYCESYKVEQREYAKTYPYAPFPGPRGEISYQFSKAMEKMRLAGLGDQVDALRQRILDTRKFRRRALGTAD